MNRLVAEADPLSNVKYIGYDELGRKTWETDRKNHKSTEPNVFTVVNDLGATEYRMRTVYTYDDLDMLRKVTNALGEDTEYKYDLVGNIKEIKDGEKRTTAFDYNPIYMLISKTDGDSKTETYDSYDLLGNLLQKTDRNKNVHVYIYNEFYKVESETVTGVGISDQRKFHYDAVGNMDQITDETGTTVFTYDVLNKLDYKTLPGNKVIDYDYDEAGNLRYLKDPNGNETNYKYDELNRLKTVSTVDGTATYAYYLSGSRKSLTLPNKTVATYEYDARNVLTKLVNTIGTENTTYEYTYDENKLQTSKTEPKGKTSFVYDDLGRLKNVTEPGARVTEYAYDHAGNRSGQIVKDTFNKVDSNIVYHYNGANRLTDTLEVRNGKNIETIYQYDNNGNQTKVTVKENETITESNYTYDGFNQLRKASSSGSQDIVSKYNALGQRIQKTVGNVTTIFYYDDKDVILETRSDGASFWNVQGVNLIARKTGNDVLYYNYNGHGDVVKVTDKAGARVNEYDYDVFGNSTYTLESKQNPYKYSGYYFDDETGYYYLNARFYDPKIARFISEDTYSGEYNDPLSLNLYTYCQNDPITYNDPNGHFLNVVIGAFIGGVVNTAITAAADYIEHGKFTKGFKDYSGAFVEGAVVGGAVAANGGTSLIAMAASTTVGSMAGNAAKQFITTGKVELGEVALSGVGGLIGVGVGKALSVVGGKIVGNLAKTAFGKSVIAKAKSLTSKVMSKVSGVTTKIKSLVKAESKKFGSKVKPRLSSGVGSNYSLNTKFKGKFSVKGASDVEPGIGNGSSIVKMEDEVFNQNLAESYLKIEPEKIGDYVINGNKGKVGDTFNRNIFYIKKSGKENIREFKELDLHANNGTNNG